MNAVRRFLPIILLGLCLICAPSWPRSFLANDLPPDFTVFWTVARLAFQQPELIYDDAVVTLMQVDLVGAVNSIRPWAYPPSALLPLLPFGLMPFQLSLPCFVAVSLGAFLIAARRLFDRRQALALGLVALSQPAIFAALNGQMVFLIGALVIAALTILPSFPLRAGLLLGVAAAVKPQLLIFAPLALLADRQYRALGAMMIAGAGMILLSLPFGTERWIEWLAAISRFRDTVASLDILYRNITPTGILWFLGLTGRAQAIANATLAGLGAWMVWRVFRLGADIPVRLVALVGGAFFAVPYAMNYDLVLLVPAAASFLVRADKPDAALLPALFGGLMLVSGGLWTPLVTVLFVGVTLKDYAWPAVDRVPTKRPASANLGFADS
jgi:hypothetical protein